MSSISDNRGLRVSRPRRGVAAPERRRGRPVSPAARNRAGAAQEAAPGSFVGMLGLRRVQLGVGILMGVLLPALVRWRLDWIHWLPVTAPFDAAPNLGVGNAMIGSAVALVLGFITWRQMKSHPGAGSGGYVLYAFGLTFGVLGVALLFLRADYSRFQVFGSFVLTVGWFLFVDIVTRRTAVLRLAFIPRLDRGDLPSAARVSWHRLAEPQLPGSGINGVVADLRDELPPEWERFLAHCALEGLPVYDVRHISELITGQLRVEHLSENNLSSTLARALYARAKRLVDLALALAAVPVFAPVLLIAAIAVKLESKGPALFTQARMGHRGRPFIIYKLRSMRTNMSDEGERYTADNDPRITRVGAFIRKYRIDEFPQIWNIFKGEMSWIGPRPEAVELADWYEREVPFYCYRHMVRPGITGWAQVNQGNVGEVDAAREKLHYDFYYIKNLSAWLDLLIGAKTAWTMLTGFGSR